MNFYPIKTDDNTMSLYNLDVGDVYHSKIGAYTESLHKYVLPSGILEFAKANNEVRILDICFGLGYNSRTAVSEVLKINPNAHLHITALEIDPTVLAFSTLIAEDLYQDELNFQFINCLHTQINIPHVIEYYIKNTRARMPYIESIIPGAYDLIQLDEISAKLHNIYYRSISNRNKCPDNYAQNVNITYLINDARLSLQELAAQSAQFDYIFHDPFTPSKVPMLWTVEIFYLLHSLLNHSGNLTTYTSAAPVRAGMIEAGFFIGQTLPIGKKTSGTLACKNQDLIKYPLTQHETGLISTNAGVPYRDNTWVSTNENILSLRNSEQALSGRMSSSKYLKSIKLQ